MQWSSRPRPDRAPLQGRYCRLEPLDPARHGEQLFAASMAPGADERFRYLFDAPQPRADFDGLLGPPAAAAGARYFDGVDPANRRAVDFRPRRAYLEELEARAGGDLRTLARQIDKLGLSASSEAQGSEEHGSLNVPPDGRSTDAR